MDAVAAQKTPSQPRHLLITLLGDFWLGRTEPLPSSFLVRLLGEFAVSSQNARAAVSRLSRNGLLEPSKTGRRTFYRLSPTAQQVLEEGTERIFQFGVVTAPWDGSWTMVSFSVPESRRDLRHSLRTRLRWAGFAPLYDRVWVAARDRRSEAEKVVNDLTIDNATIIVGAVRGPRGGHPVNAWQLHDLHAAYTEFIERFRPLRERMLAGDMSPSQALQTRTTLIDEWRTFPAADPDLPEDLLPADWPRLEARNLFADIYDGLGPLATIRIRQLLSEEAPELTNLAEHHTTNLFHIAGS